MVRLPRLARALLPLLAAVISLPLAPAALPAFEQPALSIGSGNMTGAYYAVSSAIAKLFNRQSAEFGMRLATVKSAGSLANIDAVLFGATAFGMAQADVLERAVLGLGPWEGAPRTGLRAVLGLHLEAVTIVAAGDREIERVADLRGKRLNIGEPGSSDRESAALLLEEAGVPRADLTLSEHPAVSASALLQQGEIDAYIYTVGHPNLSTLEASSGSRKVRLLPLDTPLLERLTAGRPWLRPTRISTSHYPGLAHQGEIPTLGVKAVLFARADLAEETVYRLVRHTMTHLDLLRRQHPVLRGLTPGSMSDVAPLSPHPGAARYFREAGLTP